MKFLIKHRSAFFAIGFAMLVLGLVLPLAGCGVPAWLSDAGSIVTLVGASFTSIASFIAGLTGNTALAALLATVSAWITKVQSGVTDLTSLITQYQQGPSTGLLADIEAALGDLQANVEQDFSNLGLPASVLSVITGIAGVAENLLAEWGAAIAGVKGATTSTEYRTATARMADLADNLPAAIATYKASVNKILGTPTGDAVVDAALAAAPRL